MLLLEQTCTISRNAALGTNGRYQQTQVATGVACQLIPMTNRTTIELGFSLGKGYDGFFELGTDIKVGDKLTSNGNTYIVRFVQRFETNYAAHIHVSCEQEVA